MSDENTTFPLSRRTEGWGEGDLASGSIAEAVQRATQLHAEALRQVEELLRDEDVIALDEVPLEIELRGL